MSNFNWEDVLNTNKPADDLTEVHIDPRNGQPIVKPSDSRRQKLEDLLNQIPEAGGSRLEVPEINPEHDVSNFIPKLEPVVEAASVVPPPRLHEEVPVAPPAAFSSQIPAEVPAPSDSSDMSDLTAEAPEVVFTAKPEPEMPDLSNVPEVIFHAAEPEAEPEPETPAPPVMPTLDELKEQLAAKKAEAEPEPEPEPVAEVIAPPVAPPVAPPIATISEEERRVARQPEAPKGEVLKADTSKTKFSDSEELLEKPYVAVAADAPYIHDYHMDELLKMAADKKGSDIHLTVGLPPMVRVDGELVPLNFQPLRSQDTRRLVYDVLTNENLEKFERTHELDFGYTVKGLARFRFNVYMQRNSVAAALRYIPNKIPSFESLCLPPVIRDLTNRTSGLVLVTGPTGSGKSTTIATMIDDINETQNSHILTIEDPIEYLHRHKKCMVNQREMHSDTFSFHNSLRAVLREDPDIILVGELRDLETIEAALTLAETGHLVFGTLHTRNAPSTIDRIIDVFPADQQSQIRVLLGNTLEAVISQQLLPRLGGGRRAAIEIMVGTPAIKNLVREGKTHQMYSIIETSRNQGMQTMDWALSELYRSGNCNYDECAMRCVDKETFARLSKNAA